ncbi:MAG: hypothetical protein JWO38_981 [Gemmataceae bacterium]|nr:hypothetical protein [Gemmataceae bacterium]
MSDKPNPEPPSPRYTQVGNWKHLITDEQEWLARPSQWGIQYLPEDIRLRKQQLFEHHYYPRLAGWIRCEVCRPLIAECFIEDGAVSPDPIPEDRTAFREWYAIRHPPGPCDGWDCLRAAYFFKCGIVTGSELLNKLIDCLFGACDRRAREERTNWYRRTREEWDRSLALELVGPNPFRPVAFDPSWRASTAAALARQVYESRDFAPMPILADALQDAGCESADVLDHCRGPGPHVRGCWVVDWVLAKE